MDYADLAVGMVVDRRVLGFRLGDPLELSEQEFGSEYVDDVHRRRRFLRRDYGLLELTFTGAVWMCTTLCFQVHRLDGERAVSIPGALRSEFGHPPRYVQFEEFRRRLADNGFSVTDLGCDDGICRYAVGETNCEVVTYSRSGGESDVESLWSVSIW